ncbi:MAG: hypothetical protein CV090_14385 [Nitrospira sp. WS238]|nr:hypothetical protein [Nitrospira sp. WS238]
MPSRLLVTLYFCSLSLGCALLPKDHYDQYVVCPYDTVWNAATDTMKMFPAKLQNKETGVIETGWTEWEGAERGYGLFQRTSTGFGNRERARMILTVKRVSDVTEVVVFENRERWHPKGGVTSQATRWWPIEPSEEAMAAVMTRINTKLKDQGCTPS